MSSAKWRPFVSASMCYNGSKGAKILQNTFWIDYAKALEIGIK